MRAGFLLGCAVLALPMSVASQQQTTWCSRVGNQVMCNTTASPPPNTALNESEANFGTALGSAIGDMFARRREEHEAKAAAQAAAAQAAAQAQQVAANQKAMSDIIAAFAADPSHPYFGLVRKSMASIVYMYPELPPQEAMQRAYNDAVLADPDVQALIAKGRN